MTTINGNDSEPPWERNRYRPDDKTPAGPVRARPSAATVGDHARPVPAPQIAIEWARDMPDQANSLREIVQGVLVAGSMACMYGESNSGKSYLATHLAFCITRGEPWLGRQVEKGAVLYVAGEGAASIRRRVRAHESHYGCQVGAFGLIPEALSLLDGSADVEALIPRIHEAAKEAGETVTLVIVDTLSRAMPGANENSSEDMTRLVAAGDRIREQTGAAVLWVHHSGKDQAKGARGHSSLRAALDTELECTADAALHVHTLTVTKQRDLDSNGQRLSGTFVPVELGHSKWGDPITACAVEDAEAPPPKIKAARLGATQEAILAVLSGAGRDLTVPEIAEKLAPQGIQGSGIWNSVNALKKNGIVTVAAHRVHVNRR